MATTWRSPSRPSGEALGVTPRQALAFVRQHGVVLESAHGPVPCLAEAIAGGPIRGQLVVASESADHLRGHARRPRLRARPRLPRGAGQDHLRPRAALARAGASRAALPQGVAGAPLRGAHGFRPPRRSLAGLPQMGAARGAGRRLAARRSGGAAYTRCLGSLKSSMIVALASPRIATSLDDGLEKVERLMSEAAERGARDRLLPGGLPAGAARAGLRGAALGSGARRSARSRPWRSARGRYSLAAILGMERITRRPGRQIAAAVFDARGELVGMPDQEPARPERGPVLRAREHAAALRGRRDQVRRRDLPRGLALPRDGALGGRARREDRLPPAAHGQRPRGHRA